MARVGPQHRHDICGTGDRGLGGLAVLAVICVTPVRLLLGESVVGV